MLTKIDWISFSFPAQFFDDMTIDQARAALDLHLRGEIQEAAADLHLEDFVITEQGRAPYKFSFRRPDNGIVIYFSTTVPHALVEISGKGCDWLEANGTLMHLLNMCQHRVTRLDVASDILTPTDPIEFAMLRYMGRFKSSGQQVSESGTTVYVGSRTSERYCKVYRYNEPHERAKFLRIEYTFKGQTAKMTASQVIQSGEEAVSVAAGEAYGWQHACYRPEATKTLELAVYRPERETGKTIFWLANTVAPLLVKMHRTGDIDIYRWMQDNVLTALDLEMPDDFGI